MVDDRESPSAGWREVCDEMDADPSVEEATHPCPDCGQQSENALRDVYECTDHGVFRASTGDDADGRGGSPAEDETRDAPDAEDSPEETEGWARGSAD